MRLLAFNLLLLFLPLASMLYLDTYERQLLEMQESSMIQQARIFASALDGSRLAEDASLILGRLGGRVDSRIRVVDSSGRLLADSSAVAASSAVADSSTVAASAVPAGSATAASVPDAAQASTAPAERVSRPPEGVDTAPGSAKAADAGSRNARVANEHALYRTVVYPLNVIRRLLQPPRAPYDSGEYYSGRSTLLGPEVLAALEGRYGAVTRLSTGGQVSVNLYSAIPIRGAESGEVTGAVLVSRSTYGILGKLYELRLDIIRISLFSLAAALLLSLILSLTITSPIARLQREAGNVLDSSGRFMGRFTGLRRRDEIGDLSRALSELSGRLEKRIAFIDGFTADLLHELKNPLAAIRSAVELALEPAKRLPGADRNLLLRIRDEELRMERLLSRLREIGRVDNDMAGEATEAVDLGVLVPVILSRYPHKDFPSVRVVFHDETGGPAIVRVNPDRLVQLLVNPVDNAASFSPPGTQVVVRLRPDAVRGVPGYILAVEDEGPGVDGGSLPRVFDRFYSDRPAVGKVADDGSMADDHAGLGLAIVKAIAAAYGASCTLANIPGGGCRFELHFAGAERS